MWWLLCIMLSQCPGPCPGPCPERPVVRVEAVERGGTSSLGSGTCVAYAKDALILTAWHVVKDGQTFKINGKPATVLKTDKTWDLAALVTTQKLPTVRIGTDRPKVGVNLTLRGFGSGDYKEVTGFLERYFSPGGNEPEDILAFTAKARNGDSGGGIFDATGTLVAVLFGSDSMGAHGSCCVQIRKFIATLPDSTLKTQALQTSYPMYRSHE
jgi:S1-C subfamily serine protease